MNVTRIIIFSLSCVIAFNSLCQEKLKALSQIGSRKSYHNQEPYTYYFSVLPKEINTIILGYYVGKYKRPCMCNLEPILLCKCPVNSVDDYIRDKIDFALAREKMSDSEFWGSFNLSLYKHVLFRRAFTRGELNCAQFYLKKYHPDAPHGIPRLPLYEAAVGGHAAVVSALLTAGANPDISSHCRLADAIDNNQLECIQLLLGSGAANQDLADVMQNAIVRRRTKAVCLLVKAEIDHKNNVKKSNNHPILGKALQYGLDVQSKEVVCLALAAGADPNYRESVYGSSPIMKAVDNGVEFVQLLLEKGAKIDLEEALRVAACMDSNETVALLLAAGADPNKEVFGITHYSFAAGNENPKMLRLLLNHGARFNTTDRGLREALKKAIQKRNVALITILQDAGVQSA